MTSTLHVTRTGESATPEQLQALSRRLGMLSREGLREAYSRAYDECRLEAGGLPRAESIRELLLAWKLLCAWRDRIPD